MKARLQREGAGSNCTREQRALFGELDPVPVCFLQLVNKRYPLRAVRTLKKKGEAEEENYSLQTEPTLGHKGLSDISSFNSFASFPKDRVAPNTKN